MWPMPTKKPEKTVYLFYGEDTYGSAQKVLAWKTEFIKKHGETNIETLEGKTLSPTEFNTNIQTMPFLGDKRLIVIEDFLSKGETENQKKVAEALDEITDSCILAFHENEMPDRRTTLFQKILKIGEVKEFPAMSPREVSKMILEKSIIQNIKISASMADYLSEFCGSDLWVISKELEKLATYADGKEITKEMIDELCCPSISASIFKLTDAISAKNRKESLRIFTNLRESGEEIPKTFYMIVRHFRMLIQIHEMMEKKENQFSITKRLKLNPYVVQIVLKQCKNFTAERLVEIYGKLLQIDVDSKTGGIKSLQGDTSEFALAIEKFIIDCCSE